MMFNEKKVKRTLMILALILCLLPVTILYLINEKKLSQVALAELEMENNRMTNLVDKELAKMRQTVLLLANNPAWENYYTEPERRAYWKEEQIKAFQYVKEQIPETDEACFLDDTHNGEEVVRIDEKVAHDHELSPSERGQPFYQAAMQMERGEVYQSAPYISADSRRWVFGNVTPLVIEEEGPYKGKKVGLIHYEVNLASLSNSLMKNVSDTAEAFVMNSKGYLIASSEQPEVELINQTTHEAPYLSEEAFEDFQKNTLLPTVHKLTDENELWSQINRKEKGIETFEINKKEYLLSFQKVKIRDDSNWIIGVVKPVPKFAIFSLSSVVMYATLVGVVLIVLGAWVIINSILKEIKLSQKRLSTLAHYDTLTGLPNRILFTEQMHELIESSKKQTNSMFAVLFIDLDRFKIINDTMGHGTGDLLLKEVSNRLKKCVRDGDTVSRFGGDEFMILLREVKSKEVVIKIAERINQSILWPFMLNGNEYFISTSIGISIYPYDGSSTETLIKHSDLAMYQAKEAGKSSYVFFREEFNDQSVRRLKLENSMRKAIDREEFEVYYQPKVTLPSEKVVGMEALIRWFHPEKGMISPLEFIPIAEETGLINAIGEWVLHTACKQNKKWQDEGYTPVVVSVNISGYQFQYGNLEQTIKNVLDETGLDGKWLELELTESLFMNKEEYVIQTLENLKKLGIKISIDDFGTGYSSFSYLKRFPIDTLKIDRSFIKDILEKDEDKTITKAIITMGHSLNCTIVAEGVETETQNSLLNSYKCDQIQGYYYSPPIPAEQVQILMEN